jgi:phospholipase D1/2
MVIEPGRNCWRTSRAEKAALLIDGQAYYAEFRKAVINAMRRVVIVGWDIDSRMDLLRSEADDDYPHCLGDLFLQVLKKNRRLHIYILLWDFAMIYAFDRDWAPVLNHAEWRRHKRMHLILDGNHRKAASHHQKIVTIDQSLAFVGGFDLSKQRLDTAQHAVDDQRRVDGAGNAYEPFHDMQWMFSGKIVQDINVLVDERWQNATKKSLMKNNLNQENGHFDTINPPLFEDIPLAIARTWFTLEDNKDIRETEKMHVDAIASAQDLIYIENQYLSSSVIGDALLDKLKQADGPEIVIVLPKECGGWLEKQIMDVLRARIISMLKKANKHDRLRIYYPKIDPQDKQVVSVHAKMFIIDDMLLKVGSANLSNRSMALDSECDILLSADGRDDIRDKIKVIRHRLLCEHMDADTDEFAEAEKKSSMIQAIEKCNTKARCLAALKPGVD